MPDFIVRPTTISRKYRLAMLFLVLVCVPFVTRAQDEGPMASPPKFEVNRIPSVPHPGPPPIPVEQIIQKFAANEDVMKQAFNNYSFTQTIRVEELGDPGGKF